MSHGAGGWRAVLAIALFAGTHSLALKAQTATQPTRSDAEVFYFLFDHIERLGRVPTEMMSATELTSKELEMLNLATVSCFDRYSKALDRALRKNVELYRKSQEEGGPQPQVVRMFQPDLAKVVLDCADELKRGMGEKRFELLASWARKHEGPHPSLTH
jgi:hypothetical protein